MTCADLRTLAFERGWTVWIGPKDDGYQVWMGDNGYWQSSVAPYSPGLSLRHATQSALACREWLNA